MTVNVRCPRCGQTYETDGVRAAINKLSGAERIIAEYVAKKNARGELAKTADILDNLYADRIDGGPDMAHRTIYVVITNANAKLKRKGWRMVSKKRGYYFEPVEPAR